MGLVCWSVSAVGQTVAVDKDRLNFLNNQGGQDWRGGGGGSIFYVLA